MLTFIEISRRRSRSPSGISMRHFPCHLEDKAKQASKLIKFSLKLRAVAERLKLVIVV